ncbi:hypothetical protein D3C72_1761210 [compost metagenome]
MEILRRNTVKSESFINLETKTLIVARVTEQYAAFGSRLLQSQKTFSDECTTNSFTLPARLNRHGAKPIPVAISTIDEHGRKSHVTKKRPFFLSNQ